MFDIGITKDGDFVIDNNTSSLKLVDQDALKTQLAYCRIKSVTHDWFYDHIGSDLEEIIGLPNTEEIREYGKSKILHAITFDSLYMAEDVYIDVKSDTNRIVYYVYLRTLKGDSATLIIVDLDLIDCNNVKILTNNDSEVG